MLRPKWTKDKEREDDNEAVGFEVAPEMSTQDQLNPSKGEQPPEIRTRAESSHLQLATEREKRHPGASDVQNVDIESIEIESIDSESIDTESINVETIGVEIIDVETIDVETIDVETIDVENVNVENTNIENINVENINIRNFNIENINVQSINVQSINVQSINVQSINVQSINVQSINVQSINVKTSKDDTDAQRPTEDQRAVHVPEKGRSGQAESQSWKAYGLEFDVTVVMDSKRRFRKLEELGEEWAIG
jgi:hypothetical protein